MVGTDNQEPTMEEILASIRRIISEEEDSGAASEPAPPPPPPPPAPAPAPAAAPAEPSGGGSQADIDALFDSFDSTPEPEPEPEPEPATAFEDVFELTDIVDDDVPGIVSAETEAAAGAAFADLSTLLVSGYTGSANTLEGLVREMLKPLLKAYLDQHLPRIVEEQVRLEIERISRKR